MKLRDVLGLAPTSQQETHPANAKPVRPVVVSRESAPFHDDAREVENWPCPHCGHSASVEDVDWSLDGERRLTFWSCSPCQLAAVTPDAVKAPPTGWVKKTAQ